MKYIFKAIFFLVHRIVSVLIYAAYYFVMLLWNFKFLTNKQTDDFFNRAEDIYETF